MRGQQWPRMRWSGWFSPFPLILRFITHIGNHLISTIVQNRLWLWKENSRINNTTTKPKCFTHEVLFVFQIRQMGCSPSMGKLLVSTPRPRHHRAKEGNPLTSWHPHPNTGTIMQNLLYQRPRQLTVLTPPLKEKTKHQPRPRRLAQKLLLSSIHHHPAGPPHSHRSDQLTDLHIETNKF